MSERIAPGFIAARIGARRWGGACGAAILMAHVSGGNDTAPGTLEFPGVNGCVCFPFEFVAAFSLYRSDHGDDHDCGQRQDNEFL